MPRSIPLFVHLAACTAALFVAACERQPVAPANAGAQVTARALEGDPDAIAEVGRNYMTGASGYPLNAGKARDMFEYAAQKGSGAGLFYLGLLAYEGNGSAPDIKEACGLFAQSAARKHPGGLREYGECQLRGLGGIARDPRAAADSFRASIANGGLQAYESLARLHDSGEGVARDAREAARLRQQREALRGAH